MIGRVESALQCRIGADENAIVSAMFVGSLRRPMQPRPDPRYRIIIAHLKHAASRLNPVPGAPPRHKRAGQRRIQEIDRSGVVAMIRLRGSGRGCIGRRKDPTNIADTMAFSSAPILHWRAGSTWPIITI